MATKVVNLFDPRFSGVKLLHIIEHPEPNKTAYDVTDVLESEPQTTLVGVTNVTTLVPKRVIRRFIRPRSMNNLYCKCPDCRKYFKKGVPDYKEEVIWRAE